MDKEALIKLIWLGIITGWEEFIEEMKKELWIDDETKCEETEEQINARFLRGKQDEIDNLRKQLEKEESKSKYYSDLYYQQSLEYDKLLAENQRLLDLINKKWPQWATWASN